VATPFFLSARHSVTQRGVLVSPVVRYQPTNDPVPHEKRALVNTGILRLIRAGENPSRQDVFNAFTGRGGLHGLDYKEFANRYEYSSAKQEWEQGQFFTPDWICRLATSVLEITDTSSVCDPTCGHGAWFNHIPDGALMLGNEIDADAAEVAKFLYPTAMISTDDIRTYTPAPVTHILGNPPFGLRWLAPGCPMANDKGEARSEDVFLWFVANHLRMGGLAAVVVPSGWLTDELTDAKAIEFFRKRFVMLGQVDLPEDAFVRYGCKCVSAKLVIFGTLNITFTKEQFPRVDGRHWSATTPVESMDITAIAKEVSCYLRATASLRSPLSVEQSMSRMSESPSLDYMFKKYHYQLKLRDPDAAAAQANRWVVAHLPKPAGMKFEEWERTRLKPETVVNETRRLVKRQHIVPRRLVRLCKGNGSIFLRSYSPAAAAALRSQESFWENIELCRGGRIDLSTLEENLQGLNSRETAEPIAFETFNFDKVVRRIRRRFNTWLTPVEESDSPAMRELVEAEFETVNKCGQFRREELQLREIARVLPKTGALLNWEMGCGKTLGSILWARCQKRLLAERRARHGSTLIISSALSISMNWTGALKQMGLDAAVITRADQLDGPLPEFVLVTHTTLQKLKRQLRAAGKTKRITQLIVDESDELGNRQAARTRSGLFVSRSILKRLIATGTPARNSASELFTQLDLLFAGSPAFHCVGKTRVVWNADLKDVVEEPNTFYGERYESFRGIVEFRRAHAPYKPTVLGVQRSLPTVPNAAALSDFLKCVRSRLRLSDLRGSNPLHISTTALPMRPMHFAVYDAIAEHVRGIIRAELADDSRKTSLLAIAQQIRVLQQACSDPETHAPGFPLDESSKRQHILSRVRNSTASHIAVGTIWKISAENISDFLKSKGAGREVFYFNGEASFPTRRKLLSDFMRCPRAVIVTTQQSLRSSVNVPCVSEVIAEALPWNFPSLEQWARRFVRYDSTHSSVNLEILACQNTIEEQILGLLLRKANVTRVATGDNLACDEELFSQYGIDSDDLMTLVEYLMGEDRALAA
jgi:Type I restriction-modification system methyltransferase subunit